MESLQFARIVWVLGIQRRRPGTCPPGTYTGTEQWEHHAADHSQDGVMYFKGNASTEEVAPKNIWGCLEGFRGGDTCFVYWRRYRRFRGRKEGRKEGRKDRRESGRWECRGGEEKEERRKKRKEREQVAQMLMRAVTRSWKCWCDWRVWGPLLHGDTRGILGRINLYQAVLSRALQDT